MKTKRVRGSFSFKLTFIYTICAFHKKDMNVCIYYMRRFMSLYFKFTVYYERVLRSPEFSKWINWETWNCQHKYWDSIIFVARAKQISFFATRQSSQHIMRISVYVLQNSKTNWQVPGVNRENYIQKGLSYHSVSSCDCHSLTRCH